MTNLHPLPAWFTELRDHQEPAIKEVVERFNGGDEVVMLDAPTGSGKTLIGQRVAAELDFPARYVCSDKGLQDQFAHDFNYARVLKGRSNYRTQHGPSDKTCEDCTATDPTSGCWYCDTFADCPYQVAKQRAKRAPMCVINTSYLMTEANFVGDMSGAPLVIADECDTIEGALMGFVELNIGKRLTQQVGLDPLKKGVHKPTIMRWLSDFTEATRGYVTANSNMEVKRQRQLLSLAKECERVTKELQRDLEANAADEDTGRWLRDYSDTAALILKPVTVGRYGNQYLWRHAKRWLLMSATIISGDEMADSLGITKPWSVVEVPMTFPVQNRPVIMAPVANVVYKEMDHATPKLVIAIKRILERHPGERVLVHAVSYNLAQRIVGGLHGTGRPIFTYARAAERAAAISGYLHTPGAVMVAPSMERGVDLADDKCRVQVIAKCPFPSLGDRQVAARSRLPETGRQWYAVQTVRDIVQMTGRGVRSETDSCTTYILDAQFARNVWANNKFLFPRWWRDAVDTGFPIRQLMS